MDHLIFRHHGGGMKRRKRTHQSLKGDRGSFMHDGRNGSGPLIWRLAIGRRRIFVSCLVIVTIGITSLLLHLLMYRLACSPEVYLQSLVSPPSNDVNMLSSPSAEWVAFYNIFIPMDQGRQGVARALSIVEEQLHQVGTSAANANHNNNLTIYYATIGLPGVVTPGFMETACRGPHNMTCRHLGHYVSGFEEASLEPLHQYCRKHDSSKVIYLHSKGSFHSQHGENDPWRRHLTRAATSTECLQASSSSCNVCGLLFYPVWTLFFPGNMWTADCHYVAQLDAPLTHRSKLQDVIQDMQINSHWQTRLYETGPGYLGVDRYSSEHWIASHPGLVPCDVSTTADLVYWWQDHVDDDKDQPFQWSMAPRHAMTAPYFRLNHSLLESIDVYREYVWLTGLVDKWLSLYGSVPASDSWVWRWFRNGSQWRNAWQTYGNATVQVLLEQGRNALV